MEDETPALKVIWNVPNILTVARLVLSIFCFVCFAFESYLPALIFFVIAAGTDWVDGFWARRYGQVTQLGRILDPFADKIVICGTFIFLAAVPPTIFRRIRVRSRRLDGGAGCRPRIACHGSQRVFRRTRHRFLR